MRCGDKGSWRDQRRDDGRLGLAYRRDGGSRWGDRAFRGARAAQAEDPKAGTVQTAKMTPLWWEQVSLSWFHFYFLCTTWRQWEMRSEG